VPAGAKAGDRLVVFHSYPTPFAVRKREGSRYYFLVKLCYVYRFRPKDVRAAETEFIILQ